MHNEVGTCAEILPATVLVTRKIPEDVSNALILQKMGLLSW